MFNKIDLKLATGYTILFAFTFNVVGIFFIPIPEPNKEAFHITLGMVDGAFIGGLVGYFFGATHKEIKIPEKEIKTPEENTPQT